MAIDPQLLVLLALTTAVGWLMIQAGVAKNMLEPRNRRRVCPSCGRDTRSCGCA